MPEIEYDQHTQQCLSSWCLYSGGLPAVFKPFPRVVYICCSSYLERSSPTCLAFYFYRLCSNVNFKRAFPSLTNLFKIGSLLSVILYPLAHFSFLHNFITTEIIIISFYMFICLSYYITSCVMAETL